MKVIFALLLGLTAMAAIADDGVSIIAGEKSGPTTRELNWMNSNFLEKQRTRATELIGTQFGRKVSGTKSDIALLQRVVDEELIERDDTEKLQALGVILGDLFIKEHKLLQWRIYIDELGPTQAVCVGESTNCLFPITMLSRRIEVGLKPNVQRIYDGALQDMKQFLPHTPYSTRD